MIKVTPTDFVKLCNNLCEDLIKSRKMYNYVYGVPRGGCMVAMFVSQKLNLFLVDQITGLNNSSNTLVVDDLIDSGKTKEKYKKFDFKVLIDKKKNDIGHEWVEFFYENTQQDDEDLITRQLEVIGEDPNREGLKETPQRVVKMWKEIFRGYDPAQKPKVTTFTNGSDGVKVDEMITDTGDFYSCCEHHMIPFIGKYWFSYVPGKQIIGLSKVARIIDYYSARLQIQERLVNDIVNEIELILKPKGIALVMEAEHLCKSMRGVKKKGRMRTAVMKGVFKTHPETRAEFMNFIH